MLISFKRGQGSIVIRVKLRDSAVTTGAGKTGLTISSSGLLISTIADNEVSATVYSQAGSTIETITTLGTYAAPTATKCRFKELDATNHKGVYEIQIADARFAVSSAKSLLVSISGVTGVAECDALIPLSDIDPYDATRAGLAALPNVAAGANGGLPLGDASGRVNAFMVGILTSVFTEGATGRIAAAFKQFFNITSPAATMDHGVLTDTTTTLTNAPSDSTGVTTLLSRIPSGLFTGITSLAQWLGLIAGKQTGNSTARTEVRATGAGSGTFDETTDSQEALRDNVGTAGAALTAVGDTRLANLDAAVSSRSTYAGADTSGTTTLLARLSAARAGYLDNLSVGAVALEASLQGLITTIGVSAAGVATAVWGAATRTLSAFGFHVQLATSQDQYAPSKAGDAMTLTSGERTAVANEVEAQIIDDTDSEKVLTAITDKIASVNPSLGALTLAAIASAVRDQATAGASAGSIGKALADLASRLPGSGTIAIVSDIPTAAQNASAARTELATELARIDLATSTRLATAGYTAPNNAAILSAAASAADAVDLLGSPVGASVSADLAAVKADTVAIKTNTDNLPNGVKRNTALANFPFFMVDESDHVSGVTGLTITAERSLDGGVFEACTNSPTEISSGFYKLDLAAADLDALTVILKFTATGADATAIELKTAA